MSLSTNEVVAILSQERIYKGAINQLDDSKELIERLPSSLRHKGLIPFGNRAYFDGYIKSSGSCIHPIGGANDEFFVESTMSRTLDHIEDSRAEIHAEYKRIRSLIDELKLKTGIFTDDMVSQEKRNVTGWNNRNEFEIYEYEDTDTEYKNNTDNNLIQEVDAPKHIDTRRTTAVSDNPIRERPTDLDPQEEMKERPALSLFKQKFKK